jgi:DNA-binding MarR family transcriptional regulator
MAIIDYPRSARGGALAARLRRASAAIDADATRVYAALGVAFEQRWFGVLDALSQEETLTVNELAVFLGISHAAVSQTRQSLEQGGLIVSVPDPDDARRRKLALSAEGLKLVERLRPVWTALAETAEELDREAGEITLRLDQLEEALERKSLFERIMTRVDGKL